VLADSGGNAVVEVRQRRSTEFSTVAALPPTSIGADAVSTAVVRGPDGAYYISQLTGFTFQPGAANIWRVEPGAAPTVYASGLTNVTDLAFARDGTLYAVEIASQGLLNGPIGSLKKITPGGSQHETIVGGLFAPYGVALARSAAYVSTCTVASAGARSSASRSTDIIRARLATKLLPSPTELAASASLRRLTHLVVATG
jgi:hypothetical protein